MYLAKLGYLIFPAGAASIEFRVRFFDAAVASLLIGLMYLMLRRCFETSRAAAILGCGLLVFSVCRLDETDVIGPHSLFLGCTLAMLALGYKWREQPGWPAALALGAVLGYGGMAMTYVIPVALCWAVAVTVAGRGWFSWDGSNFRITQWIVPMALVAGSILLVCWPPSIIHHQLLRDFKFYLKYPYHPTIVNGKIYMVTPRWAVVWWMVNYDPPIAAVSATVLGIAAWKCWRQRRVEPRELYLGVWIAFLLATALTAHIAGYRNLLQLIGVLCFAAAALFDDVFPAAGRAAVSALIVAIACLNLIRLQTSPNYIPYPATAGYREFVQQNQDRIAEHAKAIVYGIPILQLYAREENKRIAWDTEEAPWMVPGVPEAGSDVKYMLMPSLYDRFPPDHPMRSVVEAHWKKVWTYRMPKVWDLSLYENPGYIAPH